MTHEEIEAIPIPTGFYMNDEVYYTAELIYYMAVSLELKKEQLKLL